jgi:hypothetical protein
MDKNKQNKTIKTETDVFNNTPITRQYQNLASQSITVDIPSKVKLNGQKLRISFWYEPYSCILGCANDN